MLDTMFWNATLKADPQSLSISGSSTAEHTKQTNRVLSSGLVAISLNGNNITKSGVDLLQKVIATNHWFLGE